MEAKLIEYAYPGSTTATKAGMGNTGCWFVALYKSVTECKKKRILQHFATKQEATNYAESIPNPYNWMHKYN